jgi:hypothetical protein
VPGRESVIGADDVGRRPAETREELYRNPLDCACRQDNKPAACATSPPVVRCGPMILLGLTLGPGDTMLLLLFEIAALQRGFARRSG